MKKYKQKIFEILITALCSAGIAFLQNILASHQITPDVVAQPTTAAATGLVVSTLKNLKHFV